MKKITLLLVSILALLSVCFSSCSHKLTVEEAEAAVMRGENDHLPLMIQKMSDVESIVIDSIHIRITDEPMSGFLYTTWKYVVKKTIFPTMDDMMRRGIYESREIEEPREKQVIVEINNIQQSEDHKGYVEWQTGWADAYMVVLKDQL